MAAAWTRKGVRVNCIACGAVRTPGLEADAARQGFDIDMIGQTNGSGRIADPEEIGYGVLFSPPMRPATARARPCTSTAAPARP